MVSTINTKFFFTDSKCTLIELGRTRQYAGKNFDLLSQVVSRKGTGLCHPVDEEVFVNVCLHGMMTNIGFSSKTLYYRPFKVDGSFQVNK